MEVDESFVQRQESEHRIRQRSDMEKTVVKPSGGTKDGHEFANLLNMDFSTDMSDNDLDSIHNTPDSQEKVVT